MTTETPPLSQWLRAELPRRHYLLEGPRANGLTAFAADSGIPLSTLNRIIRGTVANPRIEILLKIGKTLGYTLPQMIVNAGLATPEEAGISEEVGKIPSLPADVGVYDELDLDPSSLDLVERQVLEAVTDLTRRERARLVEHAWGIKARRVQRKQADQNAGKSGQVPDSRGRETM
jgi:transcriptional regulator with XRE-family HTH domain